MTLDKFGQDYPGVSNKSTVWNKRTGVQRIFPKINTGLINAQGRIFLENK